MMQFLNLFGFEVRFQLKRPVVYIFWGILFALGFLIMNVAGGAFDNVKAVMGDQVKANAPIAIFRVLSAISMFMMILLPPFFGKAVERDFAARIHPLIFTKPIGKAKYLLSRLSGAFVISALVFTGLAFGLWAGTYMPWLEPSKLGPNTFIAYFWPYVTHIWPNILLMGCFLFAVSTLTRNIFVNYLVVILFLVLYLLGNTFMKDLEYEALTSLMDPLGSNAAGWITKYWTPAQRNAWIVPLSGWLLANRILWTLVAMAVIVFVNFRFKFEENLSRTFGRKAATEPKPLPGQGAFSIIQNLDFPRIKQNFCPGIQFRQMLYLAKSHFFSIFKTWYFAIIALVGVIFLIITATQLGEIYETRTYPVTYMVTEFLSGSFSLFAIIITVVAAGELVWRERDNKMGLIYDALPLPNWVTFSSKLLAIIGLQVVLLCIPFVTGLITQISRGFFEFEIGLYLKEIFFFQLSNLILLALLTYVIQVIVNQKYIGYFVTALYYIWSAFIGPLVIQDNLFHFASDPGLTYSQMNGYGHFLGPWLIFKLYWAVFAILIAVLAQQTFVRGTETSLKGRWREFGRRIRGKPAIATIVSLGLFLTLGGYIYYNTNIVNTFRSTSDIENLQVEYEKKYKKWERLPQPKITDVFTQVDLYPEERKVMTKGTYTFYNPSSRPLDTLFIELNSALQIPARGWFLDGIQADKFFADEEQGILMYALSEPIQPNDTAVFHFETVLENPGFENRTGGLGITANGSFLNNRALLPSFGYNSDSELSLNADRKKHELPEKPIAAPRTDQKELTRNLFVQDADFINFKTIVSTVPDQIAMAPGYLNREWEQNGRRYFEYEMDAPIMHFFSFLSARWEVKKAMWRDIPIEIYYHPGHEYNLDRMISAVRKSLDYYTEAFGPYQHRQVRILEFPRYATFAQSFPNTIPFSEGLGFIADVDGEMADEPETLDLSDATVDYPFYVTAHEMAHQWWAHQVTGGHVEGSNVLSETMSQYSALMVMKKEFGPIRLRKFIKFEMDKYLRARATESQAELPLARAHQQHILYQKGAVVMYALSDYVGEDSLNKALKEYVQKVKFKGAPYTTTLELMTVLDSVTPDSLRYLLDDWFNDIIIYDNKVNEASYTMNEDLTYLVDFEVETKKYRADSSGVETQIPLQDHIEVCVFDENAQVIYQQKHKFTEDKTRFRIKLDRKPDQVGIDPFYKLIDKHLSDNLTTVKSAEQ